MAGNGCERRHGTIFYPDFDQLTKLIGRQNLVSSQKIRKLTEKLAEGTTLRTKNPKETSRVAEPAVNSLNFYELGAYRAFV